MLSEFTTATLGKYPHTSKLINVAYSNPLYLSLLLLDRAEHFTAINNHKYYNMKVRTSLPS